MVHRAIIIKCYFTYGQIQLCRIACIIVYGYGCCKCNNPLGSTAIFQYLSIVLLSKKIDLGFPFDPHVDYMFSLMTLLIGP